MGGCVRDLLLGRPPADLDIAVAGDPATYARAVAEHTGRRVVAMGRPGQEVFRLASKDVLIDVTALRNGRIEDDLRARDFTVNAMAWDLQGRRLVDPLNGQSDMAKRRIRVVTEHAFEDDPLRLLRAYRIAATLAFDIAASSRAGICKASALIDRPAGERIRVELLQLLATPDSMRLVRMMADDHLLTALFPEMRAMQECRQNEHHDFDVFEHTLQAYAALEELIDSAGGINPALETRYQDAPTTAAVLKYALLLHDVGKPATRRVDGDGRSRFLGHAECSARMAATVNDRLRLSRRESAQAETVIRLHIRPLDLYTAHSRQGAGPKAIHRLFRSADPWTPDVLVHALADRRGKRRTPTPEDDAFTGFVAGLIDHYFETYRPAMAGAPLLRGHDLMRHCGLEPGPAMGALLDLIEEERLAGNLTSREEALDFARRKLNR